MLKVLIEVENIRILKNVTSFYEELIFEERVGFDSFKKPSYLPMKTVDYSNVAYLLAKDFCSSPFSVYEDDAERIVWVDNRFVREKIDANTLGETVYLKQSTAPTDDMFQKIVLYLVNLQVAYDNNSRN